MSATPSPSTTIQHDEDLDRVLRTVLRLLERQRHVEREIRLLRRGIEEVAEVLYNRATSGADDAR